MQSKKALNIEIGKRIQISRERAGLTQEQLGEKIDRSTQFISTIERGVAGASLETVISLCDVLNVSSEWILRGRSPSASTETIAAKISSLSDAQIAAVERLTDDLLALLQITGE